MRTSDRTYLQSLGFQDPDRYNSLHDLAAEYLASKSAKIIEATGHAAAWENMAPKRVVCQSGPDIEFALKKRSAASELSSPIHSNKDKIVGYADLEIWLQREYCAAVERAAARSMRSDIHIIVEVKAGATPIQRILQQLKTYQSFEQTLKWTDERKYSYIAATCWPLVPQDKKILADNGFMHIFVDPADVYKYASAKYPHDNEAF